MSGLETTYLTHWFVTPQYDYNFNFGANENTPFFIENLAKIGNCGLSSFRKTITRSILNLKQGYANFDLLSNISNLYNKAKPIVSGAMTRLLERCKLVHSACDTDSTRKIDEKLTQQRYFQHHQQIDIELAYATLLDSLLENLAKQVENEENATQNGKHLTLNEYRKQWEKEELQTIVMATINKRIDKYFMLIQRSAVSTTSRDELTQKIVSTLRNNTVLQQHLSSILPTQLTKKELGLAQSTIVNMTLVYLNSTLGIKNINIDHEMFFENCCDGIFKKFFPTGPELAELREAVGFQLDIPTAAEAPRAGHQPYADMLADLFHGLAKRQHTGTQTE